MRVDQLSLHMPAIVTAIDRAATDPATMRRLHEMGLDEGVDVEVLHKGPVGGCPIALRVGNITLALRRVQAALIEVEPVSQPTVVQEAAE